MTEVLGGNVSKVFPAHVIQLTASGTINEARVVAVDTIRDKVAVQAADNSGRVVGFVDTTWEHGDIATIFRCGVAYLSAASAIDRGDKVGAAANGQIKPYVSGTVIGIALEDISASSYGDVLTTFDLQGATK